MKLKILLMQSTLNCLTMYVRFSTVCWLDNTKQTTGKTLPYLDAKTLRGKTELTYLSEGKIIDNGTKVILVDDETLEKFLTSLFAVIWVAF